VTNHPIRVREKNVTKVLFTNYTLSAHWEKMDSCLFHSWFRGHQCNVQQEAEWTAARQALPGEGMLTVV
jgi:hypothetical protein